MDALAYYSLDLFAVAAMLIFYPLDQPVHLKSACRNVPSCGPCPLSQISAAFEE